MADRRSTFGVQLLMARDMAGRVLDGTSGLGRGSLHWPALSLERVGAIAFELAAIVLWAAYVGRAYLDFDLAVIPTGREFLSNIQTHYLWVHAAECGWCAIWNGSLRGGYPALADLHGSMLHPLVVVTTLMWGVLNGAKAALVGALMVAGVAQWWLGRVLGVNRWANLWCAALAVAAGNLGGRMENGNFGFVLSTASAMLTLPPLMMVARTASRRWAVMLGITLAALACAGQAYIQMGMALLLPLAGLLLPTDGARALVILRRYGLALVIALLLAGPFLLPVLHFFPEFGKPTDDAFRSAQPFAYVPLNLVVNDQGFYATESLGKLPYGYLYVNFIGWLAVLLAAVGLRGRADGRYRSEIRFLLAFVVGAFWVASAMPLAWLSAHLPVRSLAQLVSGFRFPSVIAGLAMPAILALAGIGLSRLAVEMARDLRVRVAFGEPTARAVAIDLRWLFAVPLILALLDAQGFVSRYLTTARQGADVMPVLAQLKTADLQWVNPPFGEQWWIEPALRLGLKLNLGTQGWELKDRQPPEAVLSADRDRERPGMRVRSVVESIVIHEALPGREYAVMTGAGGARTLCTAHGVGGVIDVTCDAPDPGLLVVKENQLSGWTAKVDSEPSSLRPGPWLTVEVPAGPHTIRFRYQPWDVPLGLALALVGLLLSIVACWDRSPQPNSAATLSD